MIRRPGRAGRKRSTSSTSFTARIYRIWILRYVDVPRGVTAGWRGLHLAVQGTCNGALFRGTLMPRGAGGYRVALNAAVRHAAGGVDVGDEVLMVIRPARRPATPPLPAELVAALDAQPGARLAFESWPPGRRRQIIMWLDEVKSAEARQRRIERLLDRLG